MDADLEAIGTDAHELPMAAAALAESDEDLAQAPYWVLEDFGEGSSPAHRHRSPEGQG